MSRKHKIIEVIDLVSDDDDNDQQKNQGSQRQLLYQQQQRNVKRKSGHAVISSMPIVLDDDGEIEESYYKKLKLQQQSQQQQLQQQRLQNDNAKSSVKDTVKKHNESAPRTVKVNEDSKQPTLTLPTASAQTTVDPQSDRTSRILQQLQNMESLIDEDNDDDNTKVDDSAKSNGDDAEDKSNSPRKPECPICFDTMSEMASLNCGHVFCHSCITGWIKKKTQCPICNKRANAKQIRKIFL
ncbi:hypothetical protein MIR68_003567 [Amoeboaphelidium protococcarum]|nr:hypothetical protein MIR68_003567 [Amoeboaphelidium protococcarum]